MDLPTTGNRMRKLALVTMYAGKPENLVLEPERCNIYDYIAK